MAGDGIILLGKLPPRDILDKGTPADVEAGVISMIARPRHKGVIRSCGGECLL
jgi:hypothetical protein